MVRFNAFVLTLAIGAALGTLIRPGFLEIIIVAAVVWSAATLWRKVVASKVPAPN